MFKRLIFLLVLMFGLSFLRLAIAQEKPPDSYKDSWANEEGTKQSEVKSDAAIIQSVGDVTVGYIEFPCWIAYDQCLKTYKLNIGEATLWLKSDNTRAWDIDNYFDDEDCGYGTWGGYVPISKGLYFFLANGWAYDLSTTKGARFYFGIRVKEWNSYNCKGTVLRDWADASYSNYWTSSVSEREWQQCYGSREALCDGNFSDPGSFWMPDLYFTNPPEGPGSYSYEVGIKGRICNTDGTNCEVREAWGCVDVWWY